MFSNPDIFINSKITKKLMEEYFYLYHFVDKKHIRITIIPEQEFLYRIIRLSDLEGRFISETPIPLESTNDCTINLQDCQDYSKKYNGTFTAFKRELIEQRNKD